MEDLAEILFKRCQKQEKHIKDLQAGINQYNSDILKIAAVLGRLKDNSPNGINMDDFSKLVEEVHQLAIRNRRR